jgi:hypothetical protein
LKRKIALVVLAVILSSFVGGAFASQNIPAIQQVFVVNFPKNQNVTVTNPTNPTLFENRTVQTLSVLLTLSATGCPSPSSNCFLYNATYPVAGWQTVTISVDSSAAIVEFASKGILSVAPGPCALANPVSGSFGVYPQCTIPVTGDSIWIAGNSAGHIALFLQR